VGEDQTKKEGLFFGESDISMCSSSSSSSTIICPRIFSKKLSAVCCLFVCVLSKLGAIKKVSSTS